MDIVLLLHLLVRYLVLLAAAIGLLKALYDLVFKIASERADSILATIFLGIFDLQAFLGLLIIFLGGLRGPLHPLLMFIALVTAHGLAAIIKRGAGANLKLLRVALYATPLAIILAALLIINRLRI